MSGDAGLSGPFSILGDSLVSISKGALEGREGHDRRAGRHELKKEGSCRSCLCLGGSFPRVAWIDRWVSLLLCVYLTRRNVSGFSPTQNCTLYYNGK